MQTKSNRSGVARAALIDAGLQLMRQAQKPLTRAQTRKTIYQTAQGETVRVRTCNDHVLLAVADSAENDAKLSIEGTDYLLLVMPETPRTPGPVTAFLVPTMEAVEACRTAHREWLASNPKTKGDNRTWNVWFDDGAPEESYGFSRKWTRYRLKGSATTQAGTPENIHSAASNEARLAEVVASSRRAIAKAADVPLEAVRISIELA